MLNQSNLAELQSELREATAFITPLRTEIGRIIAGQDKLIDRLIMAMITGGHVLIEGVPGLAKTLAVKTLSQTLNATFSRVQFTPDLLPADLVGTRIYNAETHQFTTRTGPIAANIVLADEINRAPAKVQSALLEAMQEKQITIGGERFPLPEFFLVLATQNPIEQEGTYPLPEAQVDRFMFKLSVTYPQRDEERLILERTAHPDWTDKAAPTASVEDIMKARKALDRVYLDEKIVEYILDLVIATRPGYRQNLSPRQADANLRNIDVQLEFGASPRAAISLALSAKAQALLAGRAYVIPQDVKDVALDVMRHRVTLSYEAEAENISSDNVIEYLLEELRTP
ncbi:MAG: AAA family ATPase [Lentisphaerae bacterium]|nr:AAA family ATPase [Lentisphaerota bacterium]